jgi:hypothetical protein
MEKQPSIKVWVIYSLSDPRDGSVRYIGKAVNPNKRLADHLAEARTSKRHYHRLSWLRQLIACSASPSISILETGHGDGWQEAEKKWISHFRALGANLANGTDGGEGMENPSPETKEKMSAWQRGRKFSPETLSRMSEVKRGVKPSLESRKKMSEARLGKPLSEEHRSKIEAANRRKALSLEWRRKISLTKKGHSCSPETRVKLSEAHLGKTLSPEHCANMSKSLCGHVVSSEIRAKMSASNVGKRHVFSPESYARVKNANTGRHPSAETRMKKSLSLKKAWAKRKASQHETLVAMFGKDVTKEYTQKGVDYM